MSVRMLLVLPALLASASSMCISVQSASQWSRQMCRNRACVRETRFSSDSSATVCSHSFQPLNQSVRIPTWSRNIMASVFSVGGGARGGGACINWGAGSQAVLQSTQRRTEKPSHGSGARWTPARHGLVFGLRGQRSRADTNADVTRASSRTRTPVAAHKHSFIRLSHNQIPSILQTTATLSADYTPRHHTLRRGVESGGVKSG